MKKKKNKEKKNEIDTIEGDHAARKSTSTQSAIDGGFAKQEYAESSG